MNAPTLITRKHPEVSQDQLDQAVLEADTAWRQAKKDKPFSHYLARSIAAKVLPPIVSIQLSSIDPEDLAVLLAAAKEPRTLRQIAARQPPHQQPLTEQEFMDGWFTQTRMTLGNDRWLALRAKEVTERLHGIAPTEQYAQPNQAGYVSIPTE